MKSHIKFIIFSLIILSLSGCISQPNTSDAQLNDEEMGPISADIDSIPSTPSEANSEPVVPVISVKEFTIMADEYEFNPSSISVNKGDNVKIIFEFVPEKIYYGGLDIKSDYFNVIYRKSDTEISKTVEFIAQQSFTYIGYWPSSGVKKASGAVEVK
ncbi:MAG: hypothetical protein WC471_02545 [Candidatus Woesearchaeota archaeon]